MKILGVTISKITKYENGKKVSHLEITEIALIYSNIVGSDYQRLSFVPNKSFGQLLDIAPKSLIFFETFKSLWIFIH